MLQFPCRRVKIFSKIGLQLRYYRVLSKALLGFSVPDKQPSMTAHYNPKPTPNINHNHNPDPNPNPDPTLTPYALTLILAITITLTLL